METNPEIAHVLNDPQILRERFVCVCVCMCVCVCVCVHVCVLTVHVTALRLRGILRGCRR